ncbi:BTAD domain-containing putative transcriptional regulator [Myceligenerans pegani]|uniref:Winged helix-turn-helix domain-containing protein n=1 Tax=Myceligenerans pegani TaxID=2776917 RepID=A0ABR9N338_9MICO|nr:BTAD domain-containing putative transcriptional regulator [Myceligenerans sp. TRM 65318]MBE1878070.1 winged helix-turn-helix domain-containing protein [Myceligenerans sp. TRM 65318]MBE3020341.1 winged helix-turn-helix domain-containing protein [Myceligenerans sp. TRM 65318]
MIGVLGPVEAWGDAGEPVRLPGPRHREVLARLVAARGRTVTTARLVDDLWEVPPAGAVGAVRTFVAALRVALEPQRAPRTAARLLVTDGPGYALRGVGADAWSFEDDVVRARTEAPVAALDLFDQVLARWRGTPYAGIDSGWATAERARLAELHAGAVEERAGALLALGRADDVVPDLDLHVAGHPWREEGWRLLALALYRTGRQADALSALRRARTLLRDELGIDPGPRLADLERTILRQVDAGPAGPPDVWQAATSAYDRAVAARAQARLEQATVLLRSLAVTGGEGLVAATNQRPAAIEAAEQHGDPRLTARVIGAFDVPSVWTTPDDAEASAEVAAAAERTLARLGADAPDGVRARLLATVATETRGTPGPRGPAAAREAETLARRSGDPAVLAHALSGRYLQSFDRTGLAPERDAIGAELVGLAARHGLENFEIQGHLVRLQARSALGDWDRAAECAAEAEALAARHERPLVPVLTGWWRAARLAADGAASEVVETAYREAGRSLDTAGMPGVARGLLPLAVLALRVWRGERVLAGGTAGSDDTDWGSYEPWARPHLLLAEGRADAAARAVSRLRAPSPGLLQEVLWILAGRAALAVDDRRMLRAAHDALLPAAGEVAAASGLLTAGPIADHLAGWETP